MTIKLVSSDLNGTLVQQHTMSDMIKIYKGDEHFKKADNIFKKQTSGTATMEESFELAGPLSNGITLRQAIEYTQKHMAYIEGFEEFLDFLSSENIALIINSTGYSITFYCMQEKFGADKIKGFIGNRLLFAHTLSGKVLKEEELRKKVKDFFSGRQGLRDYDEISATGKIDLRILNEAAKPDLLLEYIEKHFKDLSIKDAAHLGDTIGDSEGIFKTAKLGG